MMKILVTGGGGFLGGAICNMLKARGDDVVSLSRRAYPALEEMNVRQVRGDIASREEVSRAAEGVDAIIHTAAKAGVWGASTEYHEANVVGTQNVLDACRVLGISRLVHTSTPSVTFRGEDEEGVDETEPYAETFLCHYARTKAEAEQRVLAANGTSLATIALRPHLIWGPGDNHLVPRILERGRAGKLKLVGTGEKRVDSTYIENAALAHVQALDALAPGAPCAGRAYYISNGEPMPMRELLNRILAAGQLPPVEKQVPPGLAFAVGALFEGFYALLGRQQEPMMTRFVAKQLSTAHWFDISAARRDIGYLPVVSMEQGFARLAQALRGNA